MKKKEKRIFTLERQIAKIKQDIDTIGDVRRGSLSEQYNVCGTSGCKCKATPPEKHGPYYQLSFTKNGRSSTKFVNSKCVRKVKMQVKNYSRLRKLVEKWLELGTELSDLRISDKLK
ncbi:MAG: hypothetical protein GY760_10640 [Deltaproteobacteria bacterium]|nr:hypothetical protein [Deltaproteobacteria bacterium]